MDSIEKSAVPLDHFLTAKNDDNNDYNNLNHNFN